MRVTKLGERRLKHAHGERYECSRVKRNRKQVLTVKECSHRENGTVPDGIGISLGTV